MIEQSIIYIQSIIAVYGAWGVFLATMIEEVVAPIPSALVPLAAGFFLLPPDAGLALASIEALFIVAVPVAIGIGIGSAALYAIAYYGGKPVIEKYQRFSGLSWTDVEKIERIMSKKKRDEIGLFLIRLIPVIPGFAVSAFFGVVRYPFARFMLITFVASLIRAFALALLGWQAGEYYLRYLDVIDEFEKQIFITAAAAILILGILYFFWVKKRNRRT